jgi:hypothetical protein
MAISLARRSLTSLHCYCSSMASASFSAMWFGAGGPQAFLHGDRAMHAWRMAMLMSCSTRENDMLALAGGYGYHANVKCARQPPHARRETGKFFAPRPGQSLGLLGRGQTLDQAASKSLLLCRETPPTQPTSSVREHDHPAWHAVEFFLSLSSFGQCVSTSARPS